MYTATYSPEDNKLRLYAVGRLPEDVYTRVRAAGFIWAPKQELFVAPAWTPDREDLLTELADVIDDEDTSLVDRAEQRAERFEDYSDSRREDAQRARAASDELSEQFAMGQPILVGHHSERRARRDAEKIQNNMRKAIRMWDTASYWQQRAKGAIHAAKYKELPGVRHRRIKKIEADKRRVERTKKESEQKLKLWASVSTLEQARRVANFANPGVCRNDHGSFWNAYDVLQPDEQRYKACPAWTFEQVKEVAARVYPPSIANSERWIAHLDNRLAYERAMLGESGGIASDKWDIRVGGRVLIGGEWVTVLKVNRAGGRINSVRTNARYAAIRGVEEIRDYQEPTDDEAQAAKARTKLPPLCNYPGDGFRHMTAAEYKAHYRAGIYAINAGREYVDKNFDPKYAPHRLRCDYKRGNGLDCHNPIGVYLTDEKTKFPPMKQDAPADAPTITPPTRDVDSIVPRQTKAAEPEAEQFDAIRQTLKAGVVVVSAPQLFPTPPELARRVVDLADVQPGQRVLEPSAGTGNLVRAILSRFAGADCGRVVAVEVNQQLSESLRQQRDKTLHANESNFDVRCADFLACNGDLGQFDRIVMNPPFSNGDDIRHITHAVKMLKPGGRLVAICANGPRQQEKLKPIASEWIDLEPGAFASSGTNVNAAIVVIDG
jgi:protein-L-isoaspartate O-methyltransferase